MRGDEDLATFIKKHRRISRENAVGRVRANYQEAVANRERAFEEMRDVAERVMQMLDDHILSLDHFE